MGVCFFFFLSILLVSSLSRMCSLLRGRSFGLVFFPCILRIVLSSSPSFSFSIYPRFLLLLSGLFT